MSFDHGFDDDTLAWAAQLPRQMVLIPTPLVFLERLALAWLRCIGCLW